MPDESQHLCGGRCCQDFPISAAPEMLGEWYAISSARIAAGEDRPIDWDTVTICEMVIRIDEDDETRARYTCRNLTAGGLCSIYAARPAMCRDYPGYGRGDSCNKCGFTQPIPVNRRLLPVVDLTS